MKHSKNFITTYSTKSLHAMNVTISFLNIYRKTEISCNFPWVTLLMYVGDSKLHLLTQTGRIAGGGGRFMREWIYVHIQLIHFIVQQKLTILLSNYAPIKNKVMKNKKYAPPQNRNRMPSQTAFSHFVVLVKKLHLIKLQNTKYLLYLILEGKYDFFYATHIL